MPAASKSQQAFFGLVDKLQRGEISPSQVTANIKRAATNTSRADVQDYLDTPTHDLPDKTMDKNERQHVRIEGGDPPAHSVSEPQQNFFKLVDLVKKGKVKPNKVTSNVRQAAKNTTKADIKKKINTGPGSDSKQEGRNDVVAELESNPLRFHEVVAQYNEYGKYLKQDRKLRELAQQLSDIAEYAEYALTNEADDWFDSHTIRRNIKEMRRYASDFAKAATEADMQHDRLVAYYEDMGRILERYFEIAAIREEASISTTSESVLTRKVVQLAENKLSPMDRKKFNNLPTDVKIRAAWRIL